MKPNGELFLPGRVVHLRSENGVFLSDRLVIDDLFGFVSKNFVFVLQNFHFALQSMNGRLNEGRGNEIERRRISSRLTSASE